MGKTALIILNYNNCADTRGCLESVLAVNTAPVKLIVVDNASRTGERQALQTLMSEKFGDGLLTVAASSASAHDPAACAGEPRALPFATLALLGNNEGYARGNNAGLALAYADPEIDKVMILNNDILFVDDIVAPLAQTLEDEPACAIASPVLYKLGQQEIDLNCARRNETVGEMIRKNMLHYWWRLRGMGMEDAFPARYMLKDGLPEGSMIDIELPSGSCMLIKKDLFRSIGSFDPATFLYYEENILYKKIERLGMKNCLRLDLRCVHLGAATTKRLTASTFTVKSSLDSQRHYAKAYSGAGPAARAALRLSQRFMWASLRLQKLLKPSAGSAQ